MKRFTLLLFTIPSLFFSCDKIDDANTVEFDRTLSVEIPVDIAPPAAIAGKSAAADFNFSQSQTISLGEIEDITEYLNKIKTIEINNLEISFDGFEEGEEITTIDISVTGVGLLATLNNITSVNNSYSPEIDSAKLTQVATIFSSTKAITISVSGSTNTAPMDFDVNMDFDCHIEAEAL